MIIERMSTWDEACKSRYKHKPAGTMHKKHIRQGLCLQIMLFKSNGLSSRLW